MPKNQSVSDWHSMPEKTKREQALSEWAAFQRAIIPVQQQAREYLEQLNPALVEAREEVTWWRAWVDALTAWWRRRWGW